MSPKELLQQAWDHRVKSKCFENTETLRLFHGPFEGIGFLSQIAIDRFGQHAWVTEWESSELERDNSVIGEVSNFLQAKGFLSAVALFRPEKNIPAEPETLFGSPPQQRFSVLEGPAKFWIQLTEVKHPGLFLDHLPLRKWLLKNTKDKSVLNTFAYTGSLSVAAGIGGASHVTTLDLSRPTTEWGKENWSLNDLAADRSDYIFGDYFEWLPKMIRREQKFDCVILDPPSFSRGKKGNFSTAKDLEELHRLAFSVLASQGVLVTSVNSANLMKKKYWSEIQAAAKKVIPQSKLQIIQEIELPASFPAPAGEEPYLKGWILKRS